MPWRLKTISSCRDTAKGLDWMAGALDVYGQPCARNGECDIGAVESPNTPGFMMLVK